MIMTLNEALMKQNFISKILLKSGENELPKALKAKVMNMRISLANIRSAFDKDVQNAIAELKPKGFDELAQKQNKTEDEDENYKNMLDKLNEDYNAFLIEKGKEEVNFNKSFTEEEYEYIVEVNADNDVEINQSKLSAPDFLEIIYSLFVESK